MRSSGSARPVRLALEPKPRCSKFGFGSVPGGGYKPRRSRGEILCFFFVGLSFSIPRLKDCVVANDKILRSDPPLICQSLSFQPTEARTDIFCSPNPAPTILLEDHGLEAVWSYFWRREGHGPSNAILCWSSRLLGIRGESSPSKKQNPNQ